MKHKFKLVRLSILHVKIDFKLFLWVAVKYTINAPWDYRNSIENVIKLLIFCISLVAYTLAHNIFGSFLWLFGSPCHQTSSICLFDSHLSCETSFDRLFESNCAPLRLLHHPWNHHIIHPTQLFSHHLNIFVSQLTRELCSFCNSWRYLLSISTDTRLPNNVVHLTSSFQMALFLSIMYIWYLVVAKNNRFELFDHKNLIFPMYMWNQGYCTCWLQKNFLKFQAFVTQDRMSKKVIDGIYNMCMYVNSKIA